jgi:pyruvate/2-oxoglutarate/acetoin dehydrogenase E1 component
MQVLGKNVLVLKQKAEYQGLIQGVNSDENTKGKVMNIGQDVTLLKLGDMVLLNWNKAKNVAGDLWVISEDEIVAVFEDD